MPEGYSLSSLRHEKAELQKDLLAFKSAYDTIRRRLLEASEENPDRASALQQWSGTWACIGSLELSTTTIEKKILEVDELIRKVENGDIPNTDPPLKVQLKFGVIKGEKES